jgi:mannan endo-1,4-beta-mannosidase
MFERYTKHHRLHNLLWVYGPSRASPIAPYYPGPHVVDLLGQDIYLHKMDFTAKAYRDLIETAAGKVIALTEVGGAPNCTVLTTQQHSYF